MKLTQHRNLVSALQAEAEVILAKLLEELQSEGAELTPEEALAIGWTGQVRIFGQTIWHEFKTPGSWEGITYYRLAVFGGGLKSREPDDMLPREAADDSLDADDIPLDPTPAPEYDMKAAWQFVVDSYDTMQSGSYSPRRSDWTDAAILQFVAEQHVVGLEAFRK